MQTWGVGKAEAVLAFEKKSDLRFLRFRSWPVSLEGHGCSPDWIRQRHYITQINAPRSSFPRHVSIRLSAPGHIGIQWFGSLLTHKIVFATGWKRP